MLVKPAMVTTQARRVLSRPRALLPSVVVILMLCMLGLLHRNEQLGEKISFLRGGKSVDRDPGTVSSMPSSPMSTNKAPDVRSELEVSAQRQVFEEEYHQLKEYESRSVFEATALT
jgi:hypothetical protein